jgi:hypothetical protein
MLAKLLYFMATITTALRKKVTRTKYVSQSSFQTIWTMKDRGVRHWRKGGAWFTWGKQTDKVEKFASAMILRGVKLIRHGVNVYSSDPSVG